ncbi:MAG: FHA domain-containing protein [Solirubrobacteraceae bacterium]
MSVALKFGFLAVLYLFLLWVARSALRDLRRDRPRSSPGSGSGWAGPGGVEAAGPGGYAGRGGYGGQGGYGGTDSTGLHSASTPTRSDFADRAPRLVVARATGHEPGMIYDLDGDLVLGRGDRAEIRLEDPFASSRHAHIYAQAGTLVLEDLGSTNGTYLNEELLDTTPRPLHPGDHLRIGESEFVFEVD